MAIVQFDDPLDRHGLSETLNQVLAAYSSWVVRYYEVDTEGAVPEVTIKISGWTKVAPDKEA